MDTTFFSFIVVPLLIVWVLSMISHDSKMQKPRLLASDGLMRAKLGMGQGFIVVLLLVSLLAISERVLYDLSRTFGGPTYSYIDDFQTIMAHALFILPVFVVFILINIFAGQYKQKYALIFMPYFITTIILALQLIVEISIYFSNHHTKIELYIVLLCVSFIASYAIWYVQRLYNERLEEMKVSRPMQSDETAK